MTNSNYNNSPGENYRNRANNDKPNYRERSSSRKDGGGFRIRLSDNEMKAVKSIQQAFQLRSTVAVLGFSVRTLSEMIKDENLIESITQYAKSNKNPSPIRQSQNTYEKDAKKSPDPFARPVKSPSNEAIQSNKETQPNQVEENDN